jgi:hypothetical protein
MSRQENAGRHALRVQSPSEQARCLMESTTVAPVDDAGFSRRIAEILVRAVAKTPAHARHKDRDV